jgi:hypothetical protein
MSGVTCCVTRDVTRCPVSALRVTPERVPPFRGDPIVTRSRAVDPDQGGVGK